MKIYDLLMIAFIVTMAGAIFSILIGNTIMFLFNLIVAGICYFRASYLKAKMKELE